jgi:hypothetical protein
MAPVGLTVGAIFDAVVDWDNLVQAHRLAARGKRGKRNVAAFEIALADRLLELHDDLRHRQWRPGAYRHFTINEPKRRRISAAPFRDRVVHHALCRVIEPLFEARFIDDSYANRVGLGTHRAVSRLQQFAQRNRYALRADVVQHFPSIDHQRLRDKIARVVADDDVLGLVDQILASGETAAVADSAPSYFPGDDLFAALRPRGLPIGNLSSQFWSNVYLNDFDWFVRRELECRAYLRYVDDFALFSDNPDQLRDWKRRIVERLAEERLRIHARPAQVVRTADGIPWLGFVVFPTHRRLKRRNVVHFTRRLSTAIDEHRAGRMSFAELDASVQGWINHVRHADTWGLREHIFATHPIRPAGP